MEFALAVAVLCLAASTAVLAASVPFLFWKCFRLEARVEEQRKQIDTLDEALDSLLEQVGVKQSGEQP